jgi:hypothetical protein
MIRPKKKNAVFPVTQPTLFFTPDPNFFIGLAKKKKIKLWNFYDFKISFLHAMPVFNNMPSKYIKICKKLPCIIKIMFISKVVRQSATEKIQLQRIYLGLSKYLKAISIYQCHMVLMSLNFFHMNVYASLVLIFI